MPLDHLDNLTKHSVLLLVSRPERGLAIKHSLIKSGHEVIITSSLYEAMQSIAQDMPHLILTEAEISDGDAGVLFDKLKDHPSLHKIPILVHAVKQTRKDLEIIAQRKFAGHLVGSQEPVKLANKLLEMLKTQCKVSPYFVSTELLDFNQGLHIEIEAKVLGRSKDLLVARSNCELDENANILCIPEEKRFGTAILRMASNQREGDALYNHFPINRIGGSAHLWIDKVPLVDNLKKSPRQMIYTDSREEYFKQFHEILAGYEIDLLHATSPAQALELLKQQKDDVGCVYIAEFEAIPANKQWLLDYYKVANRPLLLIAETGPKRRSTTDILYLKKPFGLGTFLDAIKTSFARCQQLHLGIEGSGYQGIQIQYRAPAKVIGLDETGGFLQVGFPIHPGSKLTVDHPFFSLIWGENAPVLVEALKKVDDKGDSWRVRFQTIAKGVSKTKYWSKVYQALEEKGFIGGTSDNEEAENDSATPAEFNSDIDSEQNQKEDSV